MFYRSGNLGAESIFDCHHGKTLRRALRRVEFTQGRVVFTYQHIALPAAGESQTEL